VLPSHLGASHWMCSRNRVPQRGRGRAQPARATLQGGEVADHKHHRALVSHHSARKTILKIIECCRGLHRLHEACTTNPLNPTRQILQELHGVGRGGQQLLEVR